MEDIRAQLKGLRLSDGSSPLDLRISSAPSRAAPADRSVPGKSNGGLRSSDPLEMFSALNKGISFQSSATPTPSSMSVDRANNGSPMPRSTNGGVTDKPVPVPQPRSMDGSPKQQLSSASPLHQPHLTTSDLKAIESNDFVQDLLRHPFVDNQLAISPVVRTLSHLKNPDGRYIIVGDIHGCVEELRNLVKKLQYRRGVDVLIMVGDYVVKGPQSVAVLQECRALGAIGVLGNHDFTLLNCCSKCRSAPFTEAELKDPVKRLAQQMPLECELYLRSLPHMLRLPQFNVLVVHAGINVGLDLNHQSIVEVMHLRRLEEVEEPKKKANSSTAVKSKYKAIIKGNNGTEWAELWNGPELVVFGHDALRGFQKHEYAYGIDTGCVYGGPLTCVVFSRSTPQGEFVSVPGLPKNTNETLGLPPPDSSVYEQMEIDLERLLLRSTRNTPGTVTPCSFHFASSPAGAQSSASTHPGSARPLTAVNTSNNQRTTPASMFPSKAVTPPTSHMSSPTWSTGGGVTAGSASGELASQKATVLTLAKEGELRALNLVIQLSAYENVLCSAISSEMNNIKSQEDFWCPFAMFTLDGAIKRLNNRREPPQELDDAIQLVMEICDDMPLVRSKCSPFFAELVEPLVSKSIHKHAALLSRINDSSSPSSKQ